MGRFGVMFLYLPVKDNTYHINFIAKPDATLSRAANRDHLIVLQFLDIFDYSANGFGAFLQLRVDVTR